MSLPTSEGPPEALQRSAPLSVTDLTRLIRRLIETEIGHVEVEGEISNWIVAASGHAYFALKDESALLSCVMFRGSRERLSFAPEDGMKVVARGAVSVYERRGQYQLIASSLQEAGVGALYRRFLELKEKLEKEGLFAPERKRRIPVLPRRIGLVTSPTGAALRDIIHVIRRRFPGARLLLSPTLVQGAKAAPEIVRAIERLNAYNARAPEDERIDVLITARGGGSIEDLWAFNDEGVARAIAASAIPVISAVGHETDFTIADFVADLRAPTPSAAAEIVVMEASVLAEQFDRLAQRMHRTVAQLFQTRRLEFERLKGSWGLRQPLDLVRQAIQRLDDLDTRAKTGLVRASADARQRLAAHQGRLEALNPTAVLARGYSIVTRARDGRVITSQRQVRVADHVRIRLHKGRLRAAIIPRGEDLFDGVAV